MLSIPSLVYHLKLANGFGDQKMQPLPCSAR